MSQDQMTHDLISALVELSNKFPKYFTPTADTSVQFIRMVDGKGCRITLTIQGKSE